MPKLLARYRAGSLIPRALLLFAAFLLLLTVAVGGVAADPPRVGGCNVLPEDDIWNTRIDSLPLVSNSTTMVNTIGANAGLKADFGSGTWNGGPIGIPYITVPGSQTKYPVTFDYDDESDPGPYAVPLNAPIEGGSQSSGDRHAIAIDRDNCILYELFAAYPGSNSWEAGSGAIYDLDSSELRPETWTSADAAGLPIFPGLVRYDEILAGEINHAIRFTAPQTRSAYVWPARHEASSLTGSQYPPMGQRFRLKADFDISGFSETNQIILQALKRYGMILADNGSSWYMSGAPDSRWDNDDLHELGGIKGSNFEAVDVSSLMVDPDSGRARQPGDFYSVDWGTNATPSTMPAGATQTVRIGFTNTSSFAWPKSGAQRVSVGYHWRRGACPGTSNAVWSGYRTALATDVAVEQVVGNFPATVQSPATAGTYCLIFDMVRNGVAWFSERGASTTSRTVSVTSNPNAVTWGATNTPASMQKNTTQYFNVTLTNSGTGTWLAGGAQRVSVGYHWKNGACPGTTNAVWSGLRTPLPGNVASGQTLSSLAVQVKAPAPAGTYCLQYDVVRNGVAWFSRLGAAVLSRTMTVTN
jgi:hypothetical protein